MKAIETTATINDQGQLALDRPLALTQNQRVRVIVLIPEAEESGNEFDNDDPIETVIEGIREGWQQALTGKVRPVSQLWDNVDVE